MNDYVESINLYTSGKFDACAMTNMDALTIPAVGGVDSTALIVGDFSNGNDGIVMKNGKTVKDLKGRSVKLVEFTVSHYMLARALEMNGMTEKRHQDRQHERRGHRRGLRLRAERRRGDLEPAAAAGAQRQGRDDGLRLVEDSRRDHRPDGGADQRARHAEEGAHRRVVRGR